MEKESFIKAIDEFVGNGMCAEFSGLGVIIVKEEIGTLPISPLLSKSTDYSHLTNAQEIINFLFHISNVNDMRHDGFHVISLKFGLLRISQFFSPNIPTNFKETVFDVGARYRTAQYGSLHQSVASVIVINQTGEVSVAINGYVELIK